MPKTQAIQPFAARVDERGYTERGNIRGSNNSISQKTEYGKGGNPMPTLSQSQNKPLCLTKRIGSTTYKVSVHFSTTSKETIDDKIIRLIARETQNSAPQTRPIAGKRV